jgi:hypothetical protein
MTGNKPRLLVESARLLAGIESGSGAGDAETAVDCTGFDADLVVSKCGGAASDGGGTNCAVGGATGNVDEAAINGGGAIGGIEPGSGGGFRGARGEFGGVLMAVGDAGFSNSADFERPARSVVMEGTVMI